MLFSFNISNVKSGNSKWAEQRSVIILTFLLINRRIVNSRSPFDHWTESNYGFRIMDLKWYEPVILYLPSLLCWFSLGQRFKTSVLGFHRIPSESPWERSDNLYFQRQTNWENMNLLYTSHLSTVKVTWIYEELGGCHLQLPASFTHSRNEYFTFILTLCF